MLVRSVLKMIFLSGVFVVYLWMATISANAQGSVRLLNQSRPFTGIEVGNTITVKITGASPNGAVTFTVNGTGPHPAGNTDAFGNFTLAPVTTSSGDVGSYEEVWFVNGVQVPPDNPDLLWAEFAPRLPNFAVHAHFTGTNCSGQSMFTSACGTGNRPLHWIWSPVTYRNDSSAVASSTVNTKTGNWNNIQTKIQFSSNTSNRLDVLIFDDTSLPPGTAGSTETYGQDCNTPCFNRIDGCTGACLDSNVVYFVDIHMDGPEIARFASENETSTAAMAAITIAHEMGHALRLGDIIPTKGICSEAQDVMVKAISVLNGCGITAPTSCSVTGINSVYPVQVTFCSANSVWFCEEGC